MGWFENPRQSALSAENSASYFFSGTASTASFSPSENSDAERLSILR